MGPASYAPSGGISLPDVFDSHQYHSGLRQTHLSRYAQPPDLGIQTILKEINSALQTVQSELKDANDRSAELEEKLEVLQQRVEELEAAAEFQEDAMSQFKNVIDSKKAAGKKNIANKHPEVKTLVHQVFWMMCNVDRTTTRDDLNACAAKLSPPLESGEMYILLDNNEKHWHPDWNGRVDSCINATFLKELTDNIMKNEEGRRAQGLKPEIPNESFSADIVSSIAKNYIRFVGAMWKQLQKPEGQLKADGKKQRDRRRSRRATITHDRRTAAPIFEREWGCPGAVGLLDTDYASSFHSVDEDELSDATKTQRTNQRAGEGAHMVIGRAWRSKKVLDHISREMKASAGKALPIAGPAVTNLDLQTSSKKIKKTFYAPGGKTNPRAPASSKANPTIPTDGMVRKRWLIENNSTSLLERRIDPPWWKTWMGDLGGDDISEDDKAYLAEMEDDTDGGDSFECQKADVQLGI
ncbi:hypothetical protein BD779DRAFT_1672763 [Infundibulicybe gibba]|nr:hypothetical protein BD779DRAFT_1672763 [Infundibulicybe gibba]